MNLRRQHMAAGLVMLPGLEFELFCPEIRVNASNAGFLLRVKC